MAKRTGKSSRFGLTVLLAVVVFVAAAGTMFYLTRLFQGNEPKGRASITRPPVVTLSEQRQVNIYLPKKSKRGVYLAAQAKSTESKGSILDAAVSALLAAGQGKGEAAGLIPEGTKLRSAIKVKKDVAVVDLSKEFLDNFSGGTMQEALTLNAIIHTLVTNSEGKVKRARILVEGEPVESLGGAFDLSEPVQADSTLLKPDEKD